MDIQDFIFELAEGKIDTVQLLRKLAKTCPAHVTEAWRECAVDPDRELKVSIRENLKNNEYVNAIRITRNAKGIGLKEAKDYVDAIRDVVDPNWRVVRPYSN